MKGPQVHFIDENYKRVIVNVSTYAEFKRRKKAFLKSSYDENVYVYRKRRGQSGEWFELWSKVGSKIFIDKEGWN